MASAERAGSVPRGNHGSGEASSGIAELRRSGNELEHSAPVPLSTTRTQEAAAAPAPPPPPPTDEGPSPFVQEGVQRKLLKAATVQQLDGTKQTFYVHKKADGEILFDMVAAQLELIEKDYFGLVFADSDQATGAASAHHWLYKDKKIERQLKGRPWCFAFVLKFYPPDPEKLGEDIAHDLMYLQLKNDVQDRRLPITLPIEAKLAALAAQAEFGDYPGRTGEQYKSYLRQANIAQPMTESLIEKIAELHTQHKGLTPQEAKLAYLSECKDIAMYGIWQFPTKERSVNVGVNYHGLHVHSDQMRVHRFAWPSINRFSYRGNTFSIRLNAGELNEKKEKTVSYKMPDYHTAARLFNLAVEHHTFFRLIQPEARDKKGLFKLCTSNRFRYQGRTNIQSHMASQLFDQSSQHVDGNRSNVLGSKSADDIQRHAVSALHHADDGMRTPPENPIGPPLATSTVKKKKRGDDGDGGDEVGGPVYHSYRLQRHNQQHARHTQLSNVTTSAATPPSSSPTTPVTTAAVAASFTASNNAQQKQQHGELVEDYLDLSSTSGSTHPALLPSDTSTSTAVDYNTTTAVSDDGSVIIRTTTTKRIVTTTASTAHDHPFVTSHTEALAERQAQHRFTSASLISNTLSSTSSNTSFTSALDDTLVLLNDSGYEPSVSVGGALGGGGGSLRPDAAQSPTSSKYTSRVTSPSYVLNSSFDESRVSPYEGERFSVATTSLPYSSGGAQQKVRFATAAGERSRSPFKGLFARERGKSPAPKDSSLRPLSTSSPLGLDVTWRHSEVPLVPIGDRVQLYNSGVYTSLPPGVEDVNQLGETHTFTLLPGLRRRRRKKRIPTAEKILRQSRTFDGTMGYLTPRAEVEHIPLRYCVACYHSGFSHRPWIRRRAAAGGREEVTSWLNKENYTFPTVLCLEHSRLEKDPELETAALRAYTSPYHVPYYDRKGLPPQPLRVQRVDGRPETVAILHLRREPEPVERAVIVKEESEGKLPLEPPPSEQSRKKIRVSVRERLRAKSAQKPSEDEPSAPAALFKSDDMKEKPIGEAVTVHHTSSRESPSKRGSTEKTSPTKERLALLRPKSGEKKETEEISNAPSKGTTRDTSATTTSEAPTKKRVMKAGYPSYSDLYTGELHELSRAKHDLNDLPIEEHVAATAKPTIVRVEWEPEKSPGVEATKDEGKGTGILRMRTSVPREDIGEAIAVVGPYEPQRPKSIATLHLRRPQSVEDEGAKKIGSPGADNLEEGWKAEEVGSTSGVKPAALLHLRKQQPTKTTEHDVREERGSVYSYPVRSDPYTGEVASLRHHADPAKESIEQYVSIYRVAVYPARKRSNRAHRASTAAQGSEPPAEISKPPAPASHSVLRPTVLLHLKHSPELPPSETASSQPAAVRVEAVRRKPRAGKTYWMGGRLGSALRGRRRDDAALATPITQDESVPTTTSTAPPKPPRSMKSRARPKAVLHLKKHHVQSEEGPDAVRPTAAAVPTTHIVNTQPYSGPLQAANRSGELAPLPISQHSCVYHSGWSVQRRSVIERLSTVVVSHRRERKKSGSDEPPTPPPTPSEPPIDSAKSIALLHLREGGVVETPVEKRDSAEAGRISKVARSPPPTNATYRILTDPYTGDLETLGRKKEVESESIANFISPLPSLRWTADTKEGTSRVEAGSDGSEERQKAILHLVKRGDSPFEEPPAVLPIAAKRSRRSGEKGKKTTTGKKSPPTAHYPFDAEPFDGSLLALGREQDIEAEPISTHVLKTDAPSIKKNEVAEGVVDAEAGPGGEKKPRATLHLRPSTTSSDKAKHQRAGRETEVLPPAPTEIAEVGGKVLKKERAIVVRKGASKLGKRYALSASIFTGRLHSLSRGGELEADSIESHISSPPLNAEQQPVTVVKGPMAVATLYLKSSPPAAGAPEMVTAVDGGTTTLVGKESPAIPPSRYPPPTEPFIGVLQSLGRREEAAAELISIHVTSPPVNMASSAWRKKPTASLHLIKPTSPAPADETGEALPPKQNVPRIIIDRSSLKRKALTTPAPSAAPTTAFPIYEMNTAPYTGPLETIHPAQLMEHEPLTSIVKVYHTGYSVQQKGRASLTDNEGNRGSKKGAIIYLREESAEPADAISAPPTRVSKTRDRIFKTPKRGKGTRDEVEEWLEPGQYTPYAFEKRAYEGYLHTLSQVGELEPHSLSEHVALYHPGTSFTASDAGRKWMGVVLKSRPEAYAAVRGDGGKPRRHTAEREEWRGIGGGRDGAKPREHKATAVLHLKRHSPTEHHPMPISDNSQLTTTSTIAGLAAREEKATTYSTTVFIWRKRGHQKQSPVISTNRYEGPMASMGPQRHLDSASTASPLRDYVHVYNPGTSYSFTAASRPPSTTAAIPDRRPLAFLHLKSAAPSGGSGDYENEAIGVDRNQALSPISVDSEGAKSEKSTALLHLRALSPSSGGDKENRPAAAVVSTKRNHSHSPYQPSTDPGMLSIYEGPLASLQRNVDNALEETPLEAYVKVYHPSGIMPLTPPKKGTVHKVASQGSKSSTPATSTAYTGPLEALLYAKPMADSDLGERVDIGGGSYHTAHEEVEASPSRQRLAAVLHLKSLPADPRKSASAKHLKLAATDSYPLDIEPYSGPFHALNRALLFHGCPIESSVATYHPGYYSSPTAATKASPLKEADQKEHEEMEVPPSRRSAAVLHLKSLPTAAVTVSKVQSGSSAPKSASAKHLKRAAIDAYPLNTEPYNGPLHTLNRALLFHGCPIESSVATYHPGYYYSSAAEPSPSKKTYHAVHEEIGVLPSQRPAAVLHLKSPPRTIETPASAIKSASAKHLKRTAIDSYPYDIEPYNGPFHTLNRALLFQGCPIDTSVATYHSGYYYSPTMAGSSPLKKRYSTAHDESPSKQRPAALLHLKKSRPAAAETVSKVQPSSIKHPKRAANDAYPLDIESYDGPLHTLTRALLFHGCPIESSVATYHPGYYSPKTVEGSSLRKSSSTKRKSYALLHMKSGGRGQESEEESPLDKIGVGQKVVEEDNEALEGPKIQTVAILRLKKWQSRDDHYHVRGEPYTGPLASIGPARELDFEPIMNQVSEIYYQFPSPPSAATSPTTKKPSSFVSPVKKAGALLHLRQSTEAGKTEIQRTPVGYPHLTDPYVGELHSTSPAGQLIHDPLSNRVCVYHPGDSHSVSTKKTFVVVERRQHDVKSQSPVKKALAAAKLRLKDNGARQAEKGESDEVLNWVVDESSTAIEKKQSPQPSSSTHKPKAILHTHITAISQQGGTQPTPSRVSEPPEESEKTTKTYSSWLWWSREEPTATSLTIKTTPHEGPLSSMQPTGQLPTVPLASTVAVSSKLDEESAAPSDLKPAAIIHMKTKAPLKGGYVPSNSELMMQKSTDGDGVGSMAPDAELSKEPIEIHVSVYGPKPYALAQAERAGKAGKAAATLHLKKRRESASTEEEPKPVPQPRDEADSKRSALMAVLHLKDLKIDEGGTTTTSEAPIKKRVVKVGYPSHSDLYTGELHELSRAKHDLSDLPIEEHVAATAKPTIVRVEWEPEKSPGVEATKDEGKGMGILHMRTSVPREDIGEAIAVVGPYGPQRPKSIATLHLRRPQSAEDEGAKKICSPGADNLEEGWKAEKVGSTSEVKPAALLHLRKQQPTKTTEHDVREERGSVYSYPVRSDPYTGEVASLHYRADPSKEPIEQCVSIYRVAVYPARRWSKHRAHRASTAAQGSEPPAEISKLPAPAFYSLSKPTVLLHLKHSPELPPSEIASSQPAAVRVEAVRRKPRAGKTYWIGGRLAYALRGRRRLATPIAQVTRLEQMESTIRTSRVEMNLLHKPYVNEAEMGVELRREARIDYTCEAFLVRRTHRFQPPALQSLNDDGAYDGPAFLPKSLFEQSSSGGPSTSTAGAGLTFIIRQPGCQSAREQQKEAGGDNLTTTGISSCGTKEKEGEGGDKSDKSAKRGARKKRRKQKSAAAAGENRESLSAHSPPGDLGEGTAARLTSTAAGGIAISSTSVVGSQQSWPQSSPPPSTSAPTEMKDHGTGISIDNQQPQQSSSSAAASGPSIFSAIRRRLSQTMGVGLSKSGKKRAEKEAKRVEKQLKKEEKSRKKEKAKKAKKIGVDVSSSTSSSSSSSDVEVHHVVATSQQQSTTGGDAQPSGPPPKPARAAEMQKSAQQQTNIATASSSDSTVTVQSAGPYTPARDPSDGRVVREERLEQVYRIVGNGSAQVPRVDPHDARCLRESDRAPKVNMVVEDMVVTEKGPVPQTIKEVSLPHTTTHTWHESMTGPETVTTEVDEHGNIIRRTVLKSEQVRHTVQTQSYQTFRVDENTAPMMETPPANGQDAVHSMHTHTAAYENSTPRDSAETASKATDNAVGDSSSLGELVSSKAVTTGNRTVETLTYKKDKDGVVETHVEHRITIHSGDDIDHDEELSRAILEATNMNPNLNVEKVDFKRDG